MDRRIIFLKKWLENNLDTKHSISEIANMFELSDSRFRQLCKAEFGRSPKEYVKELRLEKAKELLETTFKTIKEVCFEVGFNDQRNFARDFKKKYGLSPTEYVKKLADKEFDE